MGCLFCCGIDYGPLPLILRKIFRTEELGVDQMRVSCQILLIQ
jgi:hypothetical protein